MKLDYTAIETLIKEKRFDMAVGSVFVNKKKLLLEFGIDPNISKNSMDAVMKIVKKYFDVYNISGSHRLIINEVYKYVRHDAYNNKLRKDITTISTLYYLVSYLLNKSKSNKVGLRHTSIGYDMICGIIGFSSIDLYENKNKYLLDDDYDDDSAFIINEASTFACKKIYRLLINGNKINIISFSPGYYILDGEDKKRAPNKKTIVKRIVTEKEEAKIKEATKLVKDRRNIKNIDFSKKRNEIYNEIASIVGFESYRTNIFKFTDEVLFNAENFIDRFGQESLNINELNKILLRDLREHVVRRYDKVITNEIENKRLNAIDAEKLNAKKEKTYGSFETYIQEMADKGCDASKPVYRHVYGITEDRDEMLRKIDDVLLDLYTVAG